MKTYEFRDKSGNLFAFEISNGLVSVRDIARLLSKFPEVTDIKRHKQFLGIFNWKTDDRLEFKYKGIDYIISEPFGDSSRYWIGPKDLPNDGKNQNSAETMQVHRIFVEYSNRRAHILLIIVAVSLLGLIVLENNIWIGKACESSGPGKICDKKPLGTSREYFLSLDGCKDTLKDKYQSYICASGPNKNLRDATEYTSYRNVYYSEDLKMLVREVPLSFSFMPFIFIILLMLLVLEWLGHAIIQLFKK